MRVCFFARVSDPSLFDKVQFYRADIDILKRLGFEVVLVNRIRDLLFTRCDLYFAWWFGFGIFPAILGWLTRRPTIVCGVAHSADCGNLDDWPLGKRVVIKMTLLLSDECIFISKTDFRRLDGFSPRSASVIPCAIDTNRYTSDLSSRRDPIVAVITHLTADNVRRKMLLESIDAFAIFYQQHPKFKFHVCGVFGDAEGAVRSRIAKNKLEDVVVLRGSLSESEKINLLRTAKVYFQPSRCEGFGLALLEAQACGLPVLTSSERCIKELNGSSVLYGATVTDFAVQLQQLASDIDLWELYRNRGIENSKKYSVNVRYKQIREIVRRLL